MQTLLRLLPQAVVYVHAAEQKDYAAVVPPNQLRTHPVAVGGLPAVLNWIMDHETHPVLVTLDDDFQGIQSTTGSQRYITDPDEVLAIIENAARCCADLGLTTFCFSRTPNTTVIRPEERPIVPTQMVAGCRGVMGKARHRKYRESMHGRADLDWTMQTLLEDRCIYADIRFYFDFGPSYTGRGGSVGLITPEGFEGASRQLKERWGNCLSFKAPGYLKKRNVTTMSLRVKRTSPLAQR